MLENTIEITSETFVVIRLYIEMVIETYAVIYTYAIIILV